MLQCLIRGIEPGPLASFGAWKKRGRTVIKGQKAIWLWMPITRKGKLSASALAAAEARKGRPLRDDEKTFTWRQFIYKPRWFVLSQTEGEPFEPAEIPGWDAATACQALGANLGRFDMLNGNIGGYSQGDKVTVNPLFAERYHRVLFHELGHYLLHQGPDADHDLAAAMPKPLRELEAEAVCLIVADTLGLPGADESRGYIQHWWGKIEVPDKSVKRIFSAADRIIRAGEEATQEIEEAA